MSAILKIYDDKGKNIIKTYEAAECDLMFGTVMRIMEIFKIGETDSPNELLKTVYGAWNEVRSILGEFFPETTDEEWEHVKVKDILPLIMDILKFIAKTMKTIPIDPKN